jgi:hypothetical protein
MLVLSSRFACATASMTSTMSFGHGPRSSVVSAISRSQFYGLRSTDVRPLLEQVRAKLFASDCAVRLFLKAHAQGFTELLPGRDRLADVTDRRAATISKCFLLWRRHGIDVVE